MRIPSIALLLLMAMLATVPPALADKAYVQAVANADTSIREFQAALKSGDALRQRQAALALRQDPMAVSRLNRFGGDELKLAAKRELAAVEQGTKDLVRQRLADQLGVTPDKISFFEATNPSGEIKVGQDWDVTARVEAGEVERVNEAGQLVKEKVYKDIRIKDSAQSVQEAYYEVATGRARPVDPAAAERYAREATEFAHHHNVEVTDYLGSESYGGLQGEGEAIITGPKNQALRDVEQLSQVMEYKSNLARNKAMDIVDEAAGKVKAMGLAADDPRAVKILEEAEAAAQGWYQEQARQYVKQFDKQIVTRVEALGGKVPARTEQATEVLRRLANGELAPVEARLELKAMGETVDDVIRKGTGLVEAAQKARAISTAVEAAAGKGGSALQALRNIMPKVAKGASVAAAVLPVAGSLSHGYRIEREQAAMEDRGINNWEAMNNAFNHAVTEPARMVMELFGKGVEAGGEGFYRLSKEKGVLGAFGSSFGNALWYTGAGAAWGVGKTVEGVGYTVLHPVDTGSAIMYTGLQAADMLGQAMLVDEIAANLYYDPEATRTEYEQLRANAGRYLTLMEAATGQAEKLQADLRDLIANGKPEAADFTARSNRLVDDYRQAYGQASAYLGQWYSFVYRRYGGLENPVVAEQNYALLPVIKRIKALAPDPLSFIDAAFLKGLPSTLLVRVKDAETGKPISLPGWLQLNGPNFGQVCPDGRGPGLTCAGIPPGSYQIKVSVKGYDPVQLELTVHPLKRRSYELPATLAKERIVLTHGRVAVRVVDARTGAAIAGASVRIRSPEGDSEATAPGGSLSFDRVARGSSTVEASAAGYLSGSQSLTVNPAAQADYAVTLRLNKGQEQRAPAGLSIRVEDARTRQPVSGARVQLSGAGQASAGGSQVQWQNLKPGSYRIEVSAPGYLPHSDSLTLGSGDNAGTVVSLQPMQRKATVAEPDTSAAAAKCFEASRKKIADLRQHNQSQNVNGSVTTLTLGADAACSSAWSACIAEAQRAGKQCPPGADGTFTACFRTENVQWVKCAMDEIACGEAKLMQKCGLK
ncbi:MAG: carboxypeptidase regulatory-like domain-containing protein [Gallionellaceae bacterium]|nr:carboxypeptidase regulatory-like domain-containing protein [Gallionellaceae bacterium]